MFRDELVNLFPDDALARKLHDQTVLLSEFLIQRRVPLPTMKKAALVLPHCHHRSILGFDPEKALLEKLGLETTYPEAGCCGMAGSFGFEAAHKDLSIQIGERALLPAVRNVSEDTLIIADGFSCREQVRQSTGRRPLHLAQVLQLALRRRALSYPSIGL